MLLTARNPNRTTPSQAEQLAHDLFDLDGAATPLNGEFDDNFHLKTRDGREFALKIMRPDCDPALVDLQIAILNHLHDFSVPRVAHDPVIAPDGRIVWLLDWLPGELWADAKPHTPAMLENLGRLLGKMDAALENFEHPAAERELKWDLSRAFVFLDYTHYIPDPNRRALA